MKSLKFRSYLAKEILRGEKTVTWRLFDDKDLQEGDLLELVDWDTKMNFATAEILEIREKPLSSITEDDFDGHEKFESKDEMLKTYKEFYGDSVDWVTFVKMIRFRLIS